MKPIIFEAQKDDPSEDKALTHLMKKFVPFDSLGSFNEIYNLNGLSVSTAFCGKEKMLLRAINSRFYFKKEADTMLAVESDMIAELKYITWEKHFTGGYSYILIMPHPGKLLSESFKEEPLSWVERVQIALDVAKGLELLHKKDYGYPQLEPFNILLDCENRARLTSLGGIEDYFFHSLTPYNSNNLFVALGVSITDIYSFGMLLVALAFWKDPPTSQCGKLSENEEKSYSSTPVEFKKLIKSCLDRESKLRPTASELVTKLKPILNELLKPFRSTLQSFFSHDSSMPKVLVNEIIEYAEFSI